MSGQWQAVCRPVNQGRAKLWMLIDSSTQQVVANIEIDGDDFAVAEALVSVLNRHNDEYRERFDHALSREPF